MNLDFIKKNSWPLGMIAGIILPILFFGVLWLLDLTIFEIFGTHITQQYNYIYLLSFTANLFPIRHYLVNLKFEKTGMGLLLITIIEVTVYFFMYYQS